MYKCRLKVILTEHNIKFGDFAEKIQISRSAMSGLMNDKSLPTFPVAYRISEELNMDIKEIWRKKE